MDPGAVPRLAGADPAPIALHDGPLRWRLRTLGQGIVGLGIGITTLGQFPTHVMHDSLDGLGGDAPVAHVFHHDRTAL